MRYDDEKYTKAVDTIAEQLVAMILEDGKIGYDKEDYLCAAADYAVTTAQDIDNAVEKIMDGMEL
jgi:hypothetical protein